MSFEVNSALEILYLSILIYLVTVPLASIVAMIIKRPISKTTVSFVAALGLFSLFVVQLSNLEVLRVQVLTVLIVVAINVVLSLGYMPVNDSNEHVQVLNEVLERFSLAGLRLRTRLVRMSLVLLLLSPITYLILSITLLEVGWIT